jgi:2-methylcitrate dehydratase PrpD
MPIAQTLSRFASTLDYEAIPAAVRQRAKLLILDAVGAAFASTRYEFAGKALAGIKRLGAGESEVIGFDCRLGVKEAALMNGLLVHGLDYDDTYLPGSMHLSASHVPCALAMAAHAGASGKDLLTASIIGLEAGARIALGGKGGFQLAGFHPTSVCGTLSCSLTAGRLIGLTEEQQTSAQGIALSLASGSMQPMQDGSWTKRMHPGWAASSGITAAYMAGGGFVGSQEAYEGRFGFYHNFLGPQAAQAEPGVIAKQLGEEWEFIRTSIKLYPACHQSHAFMNAAIKLAHTHDVRAADIEKITTRIARQAIPLVCEPAAAKGRPDSSYIAQFSLPYAMACCFTRRRFGLEEIEEPAYRDEALVGLAQKVAYEIDPDSGYPKLRSGEVVVRMRDGRELRQREQILPDEPASEAAIVAKFMTNAAMVLPAARAGEISALILGMEKESDARKISRALSVAR